MGAVERRRRLNRRMMDRARNAEDHPEGRYGEYYDRAFERARVRKLKKRRANRQSLVGAWLLIAVVAVLVIVPFVVGILRW